MSGAQGQLKIDTGLATAEEFARAGAIVARGMDIRSGDGVYAEQPEPATKTVERVGVRPYPHGWRFPFANMLRRWLGYPAEEVVFRVRLDADIERGAKGAFQRVFLPHWHNSQIGRLPAVVEIACRRDKSGVFELSSWPPLLRIRKASARGASQLVELRADLHSELSRQFKGRFNADMILPFDEVTLPSEGKADA